MHVTFVNIKINKLYKKYAHMVLKKVNALIAIILYEGARIVCNLQQCCNCHQLNEKPQQFAWPCKLCSIGEKKADGEMERK